MGAPRKFSMRWGDAFAFLAAHVRKKPAAIRDRLITLNRADDVYVFRDGAWRECMRFLSTAPYRMDPDMHSYIEKSWAHPANAGLRFKIIRFVDPDDVFAIATEFGIKCEACRKVIGGHIRTRCVHFRSPVICGPCGQHSEEGALLRVLRRDIRKRRKSA
jgi:hypothetical protein